MAIKLFKTTKFFIFIILLSCFTANAQAASFGDYIAGYHPYLNGKPYSKIPVVAYVRQNEGKWVHPTEQTKHPTVELTVEKDSDFAVFVLKLPDGRIFKTHSPLILGPDIEELYYGDFNNDGTGDFMGIKPYGGCGLGAENCAGLFAFSEKKDYFFVRVNTMGLGPDSLIIDPKTNKFRLIRTIFRQSAGTDNKIHSFFVHIFYKWEYSFFSPDPDMTPVWIQYLNKSNHEETKLLTQTLKEKAWYGTGLEATE